VEKLHSKRTPPRGYLTDLAERGHRIQEKSDTGILLDHREIDERLTFQQTTPGSRY
jgi:hypothetical protein